MNVNGKTFKLVNLPFYLIGRIHDVLNAMV